MTASVLPECECAAASRAIDLAIVFSPSQPLHNCEKQTQKETETQRERTWQHNIELWHLVCQSAVFVSQIKLDQTASCVCVSYCELCVLCRSSVCCVLSGPVVEVVVKLDLNSKNTLIDESDADTNEYIIMIHKTQSEATQLRDQQASWRSAMRQQAETR